MSTVKTYKSKIDNWLIAVMAIPMLGVMVPIALKGAWIGVFIMLPVIAFTVHMFATTYYTISGTTLKVRGGFFVNIVVDIATIKSIAETDSLLSAPATSLDRLEINYNRYDSVIISPKNKAAFIADILSINSEVKVTYKA